MDLAFLAIAIGYLLGSIPNGYLAGKWLSGIDLRRVGSGSTGATNVLRHIGKGPALVVFLLDVGKGTAAIGISRWLDLDESWQVLAGISSLIGHIWPIWLKGKGGKAVATGLGIFLGISWKVGLSSLGVFAAVLSISKIVSLSSICAAISLPIIMFFSFNALEMSIPYLLISIIAMVLVLWRHRSNWERLLKGKEPRINQRN